jgi:hypothetical protein
MTTLQKSRLLWWGGGILGAVAGFYFSKKPGKTLAGATLGAILVGAVGDKVLEREQPILN